MLSRLRLHEARHEHAPAIEMLRRLVVNDPAHEEARVGLMRLYALSGQRHQALRQYQQLREALRRELDAEPDAASFSTRRSWAAGSRSGRRTLPSLRVWR